VRFKSCREVGATKTIAAERAVAVTPEHTEFVKLLIPLRARPTDPTFKSPDCQRMDQAKLNDAFTAECLRLGIPARGLYALKDTFCSAPGATVEWLSAQTGVAIGTLKRYYAKTQREAQREAEELSRLTVKKQEARTRHGSGTA
jgi:hypothetical protein